MGGRTRAALARPIDETREAHWLDRLEAGVKAHIQAMQQKRDDRSGRPSAAAAGSVRCGAG